MACLPSQLLLTLPSPLPGVSLSRHILPEAIQAAHDAKTHRQTGHGASNTSKHAAAAHRSVHHASPYAGRYQATTDVPKFSLPTKGVNPKTAYHLWVLQMLVCLDCELT